MLCLLFAWYSAPAWCGASVCVFQPAVTLFSCGRSTVEREGLRCLVSMVALKLLPLVLSVLVFPLMQGKLAQLKEGAADEDE